MSRYDNLIAQDGLGEGEADAHVEIETVTLEYLVLTHNHRDQQVALAPRAILALAPHLQIHSRVDARGYRRLDTARAVLGRGPRDGLLATLSRLLQIQLDLHLHVPAARWPTLPAAAKLSAKDVFEEVLGRQSAPPSAAEAAEAAAREATSPPPPAVLTTHRVVAVLVVQLLLLVVGEDLVCLCCLGKLLGGGGVVLVGVWVVLLGGLVVGLLDVPGARTLLQAEHLVKVALGTRDGRSVQLPLLAVAGGSGESSGRRAEGS